MDKNNFKEHVILGQTGLKVSRLGIASGYGAPAEAVEKGFHEYNINYFFWSTPRNSKMKLGLQNLVKSHREDIVISLQSYDHSGVLTTRAVNKGLKALNIEYADILILGWYNYLPKRVIEKALKLKEQGKIKHIALSGHNRRLFGNLAKDPNSPIDIFYCRYNAVHRGAESDIFPYLSENIDKRPGISTYTTTCWGKLLNPKKMPPGETPVLPVDCYRFAMSNPNVDTTFSAPSSVEQLEENAKAFELGPLSDEEMMRIKKIGDFIHKK